MKKKNNNNNKQKGTTILQYHHRKENNLNFATQSDHQIVSYFLTPNVGMNVKKKKLLLSKSVG